MCDFSLRAVKSRPAKVADKLVVHNFGYGTTGFRDIDSPEKQGEAVAVCVLPGTEIGFEGCIQTIQHGSWMPTETVYSYSVAIFRQINKDKETAHHDALELPSGEVVLLTLLKPGQVGTVLQLPATPKTEQETQDQKRLEIVA